MRSHTLSVPHVKVSRGVGPAAVGVVDDSGLAGKAGRMLGAAGSHLSAGDKGTTELGRHEALHLRDANQIAFSSPIPNGSANHSGLNTDGTESESGANGARVGQIGGDGMLGEKSRSGLFLGRGIAGPHAVKAGAFAQRHVRRGSRSGRRSSRGGDFRIGSRLRTRGGLRATGGPLRAGSEKAGSDIAPGKAQPGSALDRVSGKDALAPVHAAHGSGGDRRVATNVDVRLGAKVLVERNLSRTASGRNTRSGGSGGPDSGIRVKVAQIQQLAANGHTCKKEGKKKREEKK